MKALTRFLYIIAILSVTVAGIFAGDAEFQGQFDKTLVPNPETTKRVVFKYATNDQVKHLKSYEDSAHTANGYLFDPQTGKFSLRASIVEIGDKDPFILVDYNVDNIYQEEERFTLSKSMPDNPYLWNTTINLPLKDGFFTSYPLVVQYLKMVKTTQMSREDRLMTQTADVLARGSVDVRGKKVLVQYAYDFAGQVVSAMENWMGVDIDGDGKIDMDNLSPEAARSEPKETVVFRVGQTYLSTKKLDLAKNLIVMREHQAKDYKRSELGIGREFPDFVFTDFAGSKRKLSEFRGKYVLVDIWGIWCPACREEVPFIRESYTRFQGRNLEILGLNTDSGYTFDQIKAMVDKNGMKWPQAKFESITNFLDYNLRISSFPSTFLIAPDGKILSMSRPERDEPNLRGKSLLTTLDKLLPKGPPPGGN